MSPTDYEIARLAALIFLFFAAVAVITMWFERSDKDE